MESVLGSTLTTVQLFQVAIPRAELAKPTITRDENGGWLNENIHTVRATRSTVAKTTPKAARPASTPIPTMGCGKGPGLRFPYPSLSDPVNPPGRRVSHPHPRKMVGETKWVGSRLNPTELEPMTLVSDGSCEDASKVPCTESNALSGWVLTVGPRRPSIVLLAVTAPSSIAPIPIFRLCKYVRLFTSVRDPQISASPINITANAGG